MNEEPSSTVSSPQVMDADTASKIYFWPNLMTAGNLFCGFAAIVRCIQAKFISTVEGAGEIFIGTVARTPKELYEQAVWFIFAAVVFDALDGRMARLTRKESLFGKEFDSLADIVSFGLAPALMVFFLLLSPETGIPLMRELGAFVGFFFLLCAAVRLARFNVITSPLLKPSARMPKYDFLGLPVPAAAGVVSSLVLVINRSDMLQLSLILPILMLMIALLMVSNVRYPSFKNIGRSTRLNYRTFIFLFLLIALGVFFHVYAASILFLGYVFYGLFRHLWQIRNPSPVATESTQN